MRIADILQFSIGGRPEAKGRPRFHARIVGEPAAPRAIVSVTTPAQTRAAEIYLAWEFKRRFRHHVPWTGPIMLRFTAVFEIPESWTKAQRAAALRGEVYHTARPDKDNIEKLISDALNGLAFVDDAQLQGGGVKRYGQAERLDITLQRLPQPFETPSDKRRAAKLARPQPRLL